MKTLFFMSLFVMSSFSFAEVLSTELDLLDELRDRPVKLRVWYDKSQSECRQSICTDLRKKQQKKPLVLLSHGAFGSPREMNWLGYGLAQQGWLVVGIAHYGESWVYGKETIKPESMGLWWLRSQDMSFTLDQLQQGRLANVPLDTDRVVAVGHSLGGFSALTLVGADFDYQNMLSYCKTAMAKDKGCWYGKGKERDVSTLVIPELNLVDTRVAKVITLDPAMGPAVSRQSLTNIDEPTLIIASVENDFLDFTAHAKRYSDSINTAQLIALKEGEGHFVYLDQCQHEHKAMGVSLCKDKGSIDRGDVHRQLLNEIVQFLQ